MKSVLETSACFLISFGKNLDLRDGALVFLAFALSACVQSPSPQVKDLIKLGAPNFGGALNKTFTTASTIFVLNGNCDPASLELDYAIEPNDFGKLASGCTSAGTFTISFTMPKNPTLVHVRATSKSGFTDVATATINFVAPPTAPFLTFVQSSRSDGDFGPGPSSQNTMGLNMTGDSVTTGAVRFETYLPGATYAQ